ncbi:MAG TPA: transcription elongation factor GreA [Phycisphaerales bacterium]|nr:transcription elongation factor GreA [Phycisphaerales bacterium]
MEFITKSEKETIETRLAALIANRPVIATRIAEARALGDLKENGDYHAAREQQGMEEAEIRRLQDRLSVVSVIDETKSSGDVVFLGSTVKMRQVDTEDEDMYRLVGEASATPPLDYTEVTATSPMGEALMKARKGEVIRVNTPRGVKRFEILEIQ